MVAHQELPEQHQATHKGDGQKDHPRFLFSYFVRHFRFLIYPDLLFIPLTSPLIYAFSKVQINIWLCYFCRWISRHPPIPHIPSFVQAVVEGFSICFYCFIFQLQIHFCVKWYFSKEDIYFQSMMRIQVQTEWTFGVCVLQGEEIKSNHGLREWSTFWRTPIFVVRNNLLCTWYAPKLKV